MLCFGVVMMLQGLVNKYSGLIATPFYIGLTEAGVFPGCESANQLYSRLLILSLHRFLSDRNVVQML